MKQLNDGNGRPRYFTIIYIKNSNSAFSTSFFISEKYLIWMLISYDSRYWGYRVLSVKTLISRIMTMTIEYFLSLTCWRNSYNCSTWIFDNGVVQIDDIFVGKQQYNDAIQVDNEAVCFHIFRTFLGDYTWSTVKVGHSILKFHSF